MRITHALAALALAALTLGATPTAPPADVAAQPPAPAPLTLGPAGSARDTVSGAGDVRLFSLDAVAGRTYIVETFEVQAGPGPGTTLTIYGADGRYLTSGGTGLADADRSVALVAPSDGPLAIHVAGRDGWAGGFRVRALARFDQPGAAWGEDLEPNERCELATPLAVDGPAEAHALQGAEPGTVSHWPDADSYRFQAKPGSTYEVLVAGPLLGGQDGAVALSLHDMAGEYLAFGSRVISAGASASLVHAFAQGAEICARVVGRPGSASAEGLYTIRVCEGRCVPTIFLPMIEEVEP